MSTIRTIALAAAFLGAVACLPDVVSPVDEGVSTNAESFALVVARAQSNRTSGNHEIDLHTDVHFVDAVGIDRSAVGLALDVWTPLADEGCVILEAPSGQSHDASLTLRSAGRVGVSGNGGASVLSARFLGGGPRLSGFTYGTDTERAPTWAAGEPYTIWAAGEDVGSFAVVVEAPERVDLLAVNGRELGSATELEIDAAQDLHVELFSDSDTVFVSVHTLDPFGGVRAECRFGGVTGVRFDVAELDAAFGAGADLEISARTFSETPLPISAGVVGSAAVEVYDTIVVRR